MSNTGCVFQSVTGFPICALHGVELSRMPNGWRCHIGGTTFPWGTPFGTTATSEDGNQQPSGMRGDPGVDRATVAESRDPQSPHALPVSTVQALIDQWRHRVSLIGQRGIDGADVGYYTGIEQTLVECADQLAALLASPSLPANTLPKLVWSGRDQELWIVADDDPKNLWGIKLSASPSLHRQEQNEK